MRYKNTATTGLTLGRVNYPVGEFDLIEPVSDMVERDIAIFMKKGYLELVSKTALVKEIKPETKQKIEPVYETEFEPANETKQTKKSKSKKKFSKSED